MLITSVAVSVVTFPVVALRVTGLTVTAFSVVTSPALITTSPVPFGVMLISPFVFVDVIALVLIAILSTAKSPVTFTPPVTSRSDPSHARLASSSSSPLVPTTTSLLFVRSLTAKLPAVNVVTLPVVALTVVLVVAIAPIVGAVSVVMLPAVALSVVLVVVCASTVGAVSVVMLPAVTLTAAAFTVVAST